MYRNKIILLIFILCLIPFVCSSAGEINCISQLSYSPQGPQEKFKTAYCQYKSGEYDKTTKSLRGLEKQLPLLTDYIYYLEAGSFKNLGNIRQAEKKYKKISKNYPSSSLTADSLASLAEIYNGKGKYQDAINIYQTLIEKEQSEWSKAIYSNSIGEILYEQGLVNEAFEQYKKIWVNYPQSTFSIKVIEIANKNGLEFKPTRIQRFERAEALYNLKSWNNAIDEYKMLQPNDDINFKIAKSLYNLGRLERAIAKFNTIKSPEALYWKGRSYEKIGRFKKARLAYQSVYERYPSSEFAPMGLYMAGKLEQRNLRVTNASNYYKTVISEYPVYEKTPDAAWNLGWIYYKQGRYQNAYDIFSGYSYPQDSFDAQSFPYWKAKSLEKLGHKADAYNIYESLAFSNRFTYHSFLARIKIDHTAKVQNTKLNNYAVLKNPNFKKAVMFTDMGIYEYTKIEILALEERAESNDQIIIVSQLYNRTGNIYKSVNLLEKIDAPAALPYKYPQPYSDAVFRYSNKYGHDVLLVYSLIREESRYNKDAVSRSNARGLMQLISGTANDSAREVGIQHYNFNKLFDPEVNVELGSFYLRKVLDRYNGEIPLGLASYNAGPNRVAKWVETIGYYKYDEFIEKIPITETRNYVKRILRSYGAYNAIYRN